MKILNIIIKILEHLINKADNLYLSRSNVLNIYIEYKSSFNSREVPPISFDDYIERANKYIECEEPIFVIIFLYIDRLVERHPRLLINSYNAHRYSLLKK